MTREDQIKKAAEIIAYGCSDELEAALIQDFPELKKNDDERIRKELIEIVNSLGTGVIPTPKNREEILAYLEKQKEQQPEEWSEEDEEIIYSLRSFLIQTEQSERYGSIQIAQIKKCLNWLKSLPERFNLQPKQEWSEEDEEILDSLIRLYSKEYSADAWPWANGAITYGDVVKFLKSLRPQPHWKLSEEQMKVFAKATPVNLMPEELPVYVSLYNDLKKL